MEMVPKKLWLVHRNTHTQTNTFGYEMNAEIWWNTEKARNNNTRTFKVYYYDCYVMSNILSEPERKKTLDRRIKKYEQKMDDWKRKCSGKKRKKHDEDRAGRERKMGKTDQLIWICLCIIRIYIPAAKSVTQHWTFFKYITEHILCALVHMHTTAQAKTKRKNETT